MRNYGIPEKLITLIRDIYNKSQSAVRVDGELTEWFKIWVGVRQGCSLSPYLFNLMLEAMMQGALKDYTKGISINGELVNNLRFADDIDLMADSPAELQEITQAVNESSKRFGLEINVDKTKTMTIGKEQEKLQIKLDNKTIEQVNKFVYLGGMVTEDGKSAEDIKRIIGLAAAMMAKLTKLWRSKSIKLKTKVKLYETLVIPVLMYGAETWTLKKEDERRIHTAEMGWLRRIRGVTKRDKIRNTRIREELGQQKSIMDRIKESRLRWFGHASRMDSGRLPNRTMNCYYIEGRRSRGRQPKRWMDNIVEDLQERGMQLETAKNLIWNRKSWKVLVTTSSSAS